MVTLESYVMEHVRIDSDGNMCRFVQKAAKKA